MSTNLIYTCWWFGLMLIVTLNGMFRILWYGRYMPGIRAHQLSGFTAMIFIGLFVYFLENKWPPDSSGQALLIGGIWVCTTILFELGFGYFMMKYPRKILFRDYRIDRGRLWVPVLLWILFSPLLFHAFQ